MAGRKALTNEQRAILEANGIKLKGGEGRPPSKEGQETRALVAGNAPTTKGSTIAFLPKGRKANVGDTPVVKVPGNAGHLRSAVQEFVKGNKGYLVTPANGSMLLTKVR